CVPHAQQTSSSSALLVPQSGHGFVISCKMPLLDNMLCCIYVTGIAVKTVTKDHTETVLNALLTQRLTS
ncbi:MAG: hypothetical protein LUP95_07135, partial [Euryarchaeota archaeon]|nr:hypothetical protein [Euryarchaeota archaeon]